MPVGAARMPAYYGSRPQDETNRATALGLQQSADGLLSPGMHAYIYVCVCTYLTGYRSVCASES